jgi:predicted hydrocarbon binding protein
VRSNELRFGASAPQSNSLLDRASYDGENGEIRIAGTDWILMGGATFRSLIKGINDVLGTGAAGILLQAGKCAGQEFAQSLLKEGTLPEEVPTWLEVFFTQGGWGKITARADFANKTAVVVIDNCATARQTKSKEASCHFIRGYVAGISQVLFNAKTECIETRCMSKGNAYCEFRVQSQTN